MQDLTKICHFLRFQNGNRNMFMNTNKAKKIFFKTMLPKHVHMGYKDQVTMISSISFILKHIFMYLTHFILVALVLDFLTMYVYISY